MKFSHGLAVLLLAASAAASAAPTLQLQAQQRGNAVSVQLRLTDPFAGRSRDDELLFYGFQLDHDDALLRFTGFEAAPGWDDDSGWLPSGHIGASHFPGLPDNGAAELLLGVLHFERVGADATRLSLRGGLEDPNLGLGYWLGERVVLRANLDLLAVPEPGGLALAVGGLLVVLRRGRPRRAPWLRVP